VPGTIGLGPHLFIDPVPERLHPAPRSRSARLAVTDEIAVNGSALRTLHRERGLRRSADRHGHDWGQPPRRGRLCPRLLLSAYAETVTAASHCPAALPNTRLHGHPIPPLRPPCPDEPCPTTPLSTVPPPRPDSMPLHPPGFSGAQHASTPTTAHPLADSRAATASRTGAHGPQKVARITDAKSVDAQVSGTILSSNTPW
jgi:hypothetical protein